jgi:NAD+-dependent secondary alcohol dehydrogenase Adh1
MKAAVLYEYDPEVKVQLKIENVPEPAIQAHNEVIVRIGAAGLCRTDLHVIEGVFRGAMDPHGTLLPFILGHENAGWVEAVGSSVTSVKPGDAVICHPMRSCGVCPGCREGEDMYCERGIFPGLVANGGFAEFLLTNERSLIKLNEHITPVEVAPLADAGITAYRVAKRAAQRLKPGQTCVILGIGGLGHIALQTMQALSTAHLIVIDRSESARKLAKELGAECILAGGPDIVQEIRELTKGGAHAVIDFVGEKGAEQLCWQMLRRGGTHHIVGYGGEIRIPTAYMVDNEMAVEASLVGNYTELVELMELNAAGRVKLRAQQFALDDINQAIEVFKRGEIVGRGVIVP